jgi:Flp pilus assembly pilin Flp
MLNVICFIQALAVTRLSPRDDRGQTTAEYALVLLGAAAIAVLIVSWATKTNLVGKLLDFVIGKIMGSAE